MQKSKPKKYATYDIETVHWNKFVIGCVYIDGVPIHASTPKELLAVMLAHADPSRVYYAHVGGKFDLKFILNELLDTYCLVMKTISSSFVNVKVYEKKGSKRGKKLFEIRDSYNILQDSLERLIKAFDVKLAVDMKWYEKCKKMRNNIKKLPQNELEKYVAVDCVALFDVLMKYKEMSGCDDFSMTSASESKKEWKKIEDITQWQVPASLDEDLRRSYYGGRVEVFEREVPSETFYHDVVSMYPYVMRHRLYPRGACMRTKTFSKKNLGIYHVVVNVPQMHIPPLPRRTEAGQLTFPVGTWSGWYCSVELDHLVACGGSFHVLDGYVWNSKGGPFDAYVDKWFAIKDKAGKEGNGALKTIAKLRLNTLYGKCGQRREFRKLVHNPTNKEIMSQHMIPVIEERNLFECSAPDFSPFTMVHIASFVTAYARIHLHQNMISNPQATIYYCDTDSIVSSHKLKIGHSLGDLDLQYIFPEGFFLYPKVYCLVNAVDDKGEVHDVIRAKGFDRKHLCANDFYKSLYYDIPLASERDGIIGFFAAARREKDFLAVIDKSRMSHDKFTKRVLVDKTHTVPIQILEPR